MGGRRCRMLVAALATLVIGLVGSISTLAAGPTPTDPGSPYTLPMAEVPIPSPPPKPFASIQVASGPAEGRALVDRLPIKRSPRAGERVVSTMGTTRLGDLSSAELATAAEL